MIPTNPRRRTIAIKLTLALMVFLAPISSAWGAVPAGTVTHLSGPLVAKKADGSVRALSIKSAVEEGDVLITEKRTYARLKMRDDSEITLRPNTHFKVEQFAFDKDRPGEDRSFYNLTKGGMRTITGLIGKRGNADSYRLTTPTAVAGVRGTGYGATFCQQDCGSLPDGLYVEVFEGVIVVYNKMGSQIFNVGQFGYVSGPTGAPVLLPVKPAIPPFSPPPTVSPLTPGSGGSPPGPPGCEVR
ncbi:MAG: FecR family protein [Pseudomonadota bacterium]